MRLPPSSKTQTSESTPFNNTILGWSLVVNNVQKAIEYVFNNAPGKLAIYPISLLHNGVVSDGTWFGHSNLIPGDESPIIIPRDATFTDFSFTNKKSNADYKLEFYKNGMNAGDKFYEISKDNTQYFIVSGLSYQFDAGDRIFIKYVDEGQNASDVAIMVYFKNR